MNLKEIKEIISLMNENNLTEIEIEREGMKVSLKRGNIQQNIPVSNVFYERANVPAAYSSLPQQPIEEKQAPVPVENKNIKEVKSPMVGTFYRAPSPEAAAFVEVGSDVEVGQVLCIIEAMKLMNEIKSEVKGKVKEILAENADPLEFGQVLFKIETI